MTPQISIKHFTINKDGNNFCKNFIYDTQDASQLGVFIEIKSSQRKTKKSPEQNDLASLGEFIASNIKSEFDDNSQKSIFMRFENALAKAESVINAISENKTSFLNKVTLLIAVSKDNEVYFSKHGKIYACSFKNGEIVNISPKNKKVSNPIKTDLEIFKHIINIKVNKNDGLIFLNEESGNSCDQQHLLSLLSNTTNKNLETFKASMAANSDDSSVANFALFNLESKPKPQISPIENTAPSLKPKLEPIKTEDQTMATKESEPAVTMASTTKNQVFAISNKVSAHLMSALEKVQSTAKDLQIKESALALVPKKIGRKNKMVIYGGVFVAIVLLFQVYTTVASKNHFEELADAIANKKNEAIFLSSSNKESDAIRKLIEAKDLSASIISQLPDFTEEAQGLSKDIESELNKIAKVTNIENPEKITELSNFGIKFEPKNIFKSENQILVTGSEFGLIYKIDVSNKRKGFNFFSTIEDKVASVAKSSSDISFFTESGKAYIYDPLSQKINELNFSKDENQMMGLSNNTIDVYDKSTSEIKILSQTNLHQIEKLSAQSPVSSLASDNKNIFTLTSDNRIIKITGQKQEQIADIDSLQLFEKPTAIYTNNNTSNIYITSKNQLAVFSKNGGFIGQYNIIGSDDLIDIYIASDQEIFLLSHDTVYRISI